MEKKGKRLLALIRLPPPPAPTLDAGGNRHGNFGDRDALTPAHRRQSASPRRAHRGDLGRVQRARALARAIARGEEPRLRSLDDAGRTRDLRLRKILPFAGADARVHEFGKARLQSIRHADLAGLAMNLDRQRLHALRQVALAFKTGRTRDAPRAPGLAFAAGLTEQTRQSARRRQCARLLSPLFVHLVGAGKRDPIAVGDRDIGGRVGSQALRLI